MSVNGGKNRADLLGQRFGKLQVVSREPSTADGKARWFCVCDCGDSATVMTNDLKRGHTQSCGCLHGKHGGHLTPEYSVWRNIHSRCNNPKSPRYSSYGGRGIKVCSRWSDFSLFILDMGKRPSSRHSIDRIDVDGDYEPDNCRWASAEQQSRNTRRNVWVVLATGERMVAADAAKKLGWKRGSIQDFIRQGRDGVRLAPSLPANVRAKLGECP